MADKIKYGIIGFGGIAENRIAKEGFALDKGRFKEHPCADLIAATDVNAQRREAAEGLGLKWYDSAAELLADEDIDAAYIASNNMSHASLAIKSMKADKHVFVEKPIATTLEDARAMSKMAGEKKLSLEVDHMMLYNSYNIKAAELVKESAIGDVNDIVTHMEFLYGSTAEEAATWRCSNPDEFGGPIGDVASHCIYVAEQLMDSKITAVQAVFLPETMGIKAEEGAVVYCFFENGKTGSVKVSFNSPRGGLVGTLSNLGYEIYGSEGVIRSYGTLFQLSGHEDEPIKLRLELDKGAQVQTIEPEQIKNIYQEIIAAHARSIMEDKLIDGSEGIHNLALIIAAGESARNNGKKIEVTE